MSSIVDRVRSLERSPLLKRRVKQLQRSRRRVAAAVHGGTRFRCPVCSSSTLMLDRPMATGRRRWAECARCGAYERHRMQAEVLARHVLPALGAGATCLHVAPDPMTAWLSDRVATVVTVDIDGREPDLYADVCALPFPSDRFDLVFASHVLEHVVDDGAAIRELARVTRPGGIAVLPVPIIAPATVEYGSPNPREEGHVRAPGLDYYDRLRSAFAEVDVITSDQVGQDIQPWIHEDRTRFPTDWAPLQPAMPGERHADGVPICRRPWR